MTSIDEQTIQNTIFNILKFNPYSKYTIDTLQNILQFNFSNNGYKSNFETNKIINEHLEFLIQNNMIFKFQEFAFSNKKKIIPYFTYSYQPNYHIDSEISLIKQNIHEYDNFTLSFIKYFDEFDEENELNYQYILSIVNDINEKINKIMNIPNIENLVDVKKINDLIDNIQLNIENINKNLSDNNDQINILHILNKNNLLRIKDLLEKNEKIEQQINSLKKINIEKNKQIQELKEINEEKNRQINQLKDMHSAQKRIAHQQTEKIEELNQKMDEMAMNFNERLILLEEQGNKKRFYFF
jgi:hypothetical protein